MGMLSTIAFFPTLGYNCARNYLFGSSWAWYNRLDDTVVLGALPFKSGVDDLIASENIGGVVCLNEEWEMGYGFVADKETWESRGVKHHWIPTPDYVCAPTAHQIQGAVEFIQDFESSGKSVYVHCKAGRSRSATVAACYLVKKNGWNANTALQKIYHKRPQIVMRAAHWQAVQDYAQLANNMLPHSSTMEKKP